MDLQWIVQWIPPAITDTIENRVVTTKSSFIHDSLQLLYGINRASDSNGFVAARLYDNSPLAYNSLEGTSLPSFLLLYQGFSSNRDNIPLGS